ncbi:adenylate cyclase [Enterococcus sp. JM4C]|uniref:CYTH domain-containing protein n=1 Tax=Candidatus Enterococcus huntleyi TaxID=1857217 RepID=UPI00137ACEFE|nr:CYTH domain-containing protein [Enterococcus sp. JM4C]KAF1296392.1 adenylate cyclase [Enterococcus sp. JM4C]
MSENLEIEFKTLLTESDYQAICQLYQLGEQDFHSQTNIYFDNQTSDLKEKQMGLRIRLLPTYAELTLKSPAKEGLLETTDKLTLSQAQDFLLKDSLPTFGAVYDFLKNASIDCRTLKSIGKLTTKRAEFSIEEGLLALDESWYGHAHDYELELEVADYAVGKKQFEHLLSRLSISYQPAKNKIQRMLEEKN